MDQYGPDEQALPVEDMGGELPPPIDETAQEELVAKLKHEYDTYRAAVSPLHEQLDVWRKLYESSRKERKMFPWPDAANFNAPLVMATVDSIHARIVKAVFDVDPLWLAKARANSSHDTAKKAEKYLDYWADEMSINQKLDMLILNMLIEGVGVLKLDWVRVSRQIPQVNIPGQEDAGPMEVLEYDGPAAKNVPLKDFVMIPADAPSLEEAVYVGHRVFLNHQQLIQRRDAGIYFNVDKLIAYAPSDSNRHEKMQHPGDLIVATKTSDSKYKETNEYEVVEMYGPYDFGEGPIPTLMTFNPEHNCLLRVEPYPYDYGRPPYIDFCVYPRPNFFWGRSVPEMLESAQEEVTTMHNMRADAIAIRLAAPIMKRVGAKWDAEEVPWQPGQVIEFTDPGEIFVQQLPDVPSSLFAHEQDTLAFVERVTGMSDYSMGRSPSQNRTATEVNKVTTEGLARIDVMVSRFQKGGMKKLAWVLWWLLYQYRPIVDYFRDDVQDLSINKMEMRPNAQGLMPFEFQPHGELSDASKEARRMQLLHLFQYASQPLSQFYPDGLQALLEELMDSFDMTNHQKVLGPPWMLLQQQMQQAFAQGQQEGYKAGLQEAGNAQG